MQKIQIIAKMHKKKDLKDVGLQGFATQHYSSHSKIFIEEASKFECPVRFVKFLDENKGNYETIFKEYFVAQHNDVVLDFSGRNTEYMYDSIYKYILEGKIEEFIEKTPEYNKYGKVGF